MIKEELQGHETYELEREQREIELKKEVDEEDSRKREQQRQEIWKQSIELGLKRRNEHYDDFIREAFKQIFKMKLQQIKNNPKPNSETYIILDTNIVMSPRNTYGDHVPLMKLLNDIEKKPPEIIKPMVCESLLGEYKFKLLEDVTPPPDKNQYEEFSSLTIFPAQEMLKYFHRCVGIDEKTNRIEEAFDRIEEELPQKHKKKMGAEDRKTQTNYKNDIRFAAITKVYQCILVTDDYNLLKIRKYVDNVNILHNSPKNEFGENIEKYNEFQDINTYLKNIG